MVNIRFAVSTIRTSSAGIPPHTAEFASIMNTNLSSPPELRPQPAPKRDALYKTQSELRSVEFWTITTAKSGAPTVITVTTIRSQPNCA